MKNLTPPGWKILVTMTLLVVAQALLADSPEETAPPQPEFMSEAVLDDLLVHGVEKSKAADAVEAENLETIRGRLQDLIAARDLFASGSVKDGSLTADGCFLESDSFNHSLGTLAATEAFEQGRKMALAEVIAASDYVYLAEVISTKVGYFTGAFGTRVEIRILKKRITYEAPLDEAVSYLQRTFTLNVNDTVLCRRKPGFYEAMAGDTILLLGVPDPRFPTLIRAAAVFPVQDGKVLPQPYYLLEGDEPLPLSLVEDLAGN